MLFSFCVEVIILNAFEITKEKFKEMDIPVRIDEVEDCNLIWWNETIGDSGIQGGIFIFFRKDHNIYDFLIQNFVSVDVGTSQVTRMLEICNEFNRTISYAKMYVDEDGAVTVQVKRDYGEFDVEDLIGCVSVILNILGKEYITRIMKVKWS